MNLPESCLINKIISGNNSFSNVAAKKLHNMIATNTATTSRNNHASLRKLSNTPNTNLSEARTATIFKGKCSPSEIVHFFN